MIGVVLILTRSRAGYVAGAIGLIGVLYLHRKYLATTISSLGVALIVGYLWLNNTAAQTNVVITDLVDTGSFNFRLAVWSVALQMLKGFPFTGVGMGTFNDVATRLYPFPSVMDPGTHNLFLQVGIDLGIIGMIVYLSLIFLMFFLTWQAQRALKLLGDTWLWVSMVGIFSGMLALMVHGLVDITVWGTRAAFVPWSVMAVIMATHLYTHEQLLSIAKPDNE